VTCESVHDFVGPVLSLPLATRSSSTTLKPQSSVKRGGKERKAMVEMDAEGDVQDRLEGGVATEGGKYSQDSQDRGGIG
jgi:hypothetical protein